MGEFNLLDEPWIAVLYHDGRSERLGLLQTLKEAGDIRQIAASNPMDRVALLRFVLAVLYWCRGNPPGQEEKDRILVEGGFPAKWFDKLKQQEDCFNLLGKGKRFYQNKAYERRTPEHTTDYLIHEVPSGTNKWHFRHATDGMDGLCPACCAMGLIRLPVFATSGGRGMSSSTGKSPGINSKPPLYVLPIGKSLLATLLLSWHTRNHELGTPELGTPEWETPSNKLPQSGAVPLLTGMTWPPRSVWLGDLEAPESVCVCCGRQERLIRQCVFDGKGTSKTEGRVWNDPHVVYELSKDGKALPLQTSDALGATDAAAGRWARQFAAILRAQRPREERTLWVVGFSTVQNDKYLEATECYLPRPCSSQQEQEQELAAVLERWQKEGMNLSHQMHPKSSSRKHVEIRPAVDAVRPHVEAMVTAEIGNLLGGDQQAWKHAARAYHPMMEAVAGSLSPGFTTRALQRRIEIARVVPNMTPKPPIEARKTKRTKGGE